MAFLVYDKEYGGVVSRHDTKAIADTFAEDDAKTVYEYAFDPSTEEIRALRLNAAGNALENVYGSQTIAEQIASCEAEVEAKNLGLRKAEKKQRISDYTKEILEEWDWKTERAMERDFLNGNNNAMAALAAERKKFRDDGNAHQAGVDALTTAAQVVEYSHEYTSKDAMGVGRQDYGKRG